jgi:molybdate transport system substrate-binding protein
MNTVIPAEITVLSTIAFKEALIELVPQFERGSVHRVKVEFAGGPITAEKVRQGAPGDLFIGPAEFSDALLAEGKLVAGSRIPFAISGSAVAVRSGANRPDISTPDRFRQALLGAKAVSYSRGASGIQFLRALEQLGIAEQVKAKCVAPQPGELVGAVVARGDAEIGVQQLSELLPVSGIDILGPLPGTLQVAIVYAASVLPQSNHRHPAQTFVTFLRSPAAAHIIKERGMEPAP